MSDPKKEIDMDALNAITDRVLSYTPPPKKGKDKKRDVSKSPASAKEEARAPKQKKC